MRFTKLLATAIFCWFAFSPLAYSQAINQDYILNKEGHKIYGSIKKSFDFNHIKSVPFITEEGEKSNYSPEEIKGFGLANGRVFISDYLPEQQEEGLVFYQVLIKGKVNLLSHKNRYFIENNDHLLELNKVSEARDREGKLVRAEDREYMAFKLYAIWTMW